MMKYCSVKVIMVGIVLTVFLICILSSCNNADNQGTKVTEEIKATKMTKSSEKKKVIVNNPRVTKKKTTWDCVYFGSYWIDVPNHKLHMQPDDEKQNLKWYVLSVDDTNGDGIPDEVLLFASKLVEILPYNYYRGVCNPREISWIDCSLRKWLNNDFYESAFTEKEKLCIKVKDNDKVFLLSFDEIQNEEYGFEKLKAKQDGKSYYSSETLKYERFNELIAESRDLLPWWLQSDSDSNGKIYTVSANGSVLKQEVNATKRTVGVRPAIYVDISSINLNGAGKNFATRRQ